MRFGHVALYAGDLRAAEEFYGRAFAARLLFRETRDDEGVWHTLPFDASWDDAERAGVEIHMVALGRDEIVFPIFSGEGGPRIIGLTVGRDELRAVRDRLPGDATIVAEREHALVFVDPFGVQWQLATGRAFRSSGELSGRRLGI